MGMTRVWGSHNWKTISKVNNSRFQPGDFILFKRGETWREQLVVPYSGSRGDKKGACNFGIFASPLSFRFLMIQFEVLTGDTISYIISNVLK
jgi:hypothetical protein